MSTEYHCPQCSLANGECQKSDDEIIFNEWGDELETHDTRLKATGYCPHIDAVVYGIFETANYFDGWSDYVKVWCEENDIDTEDLDTCHLLWRGRFQYALRLGDRVLGFSQDACIRALNKKLNGEPYGMDISRWRD